VAKRFASSEHETRSELANLGKYFRIEVDRNRGRVAQLGEHLVCNQGVAGSNPVTSTKFLNNLARHRAGSSTVVTLAVTV
jgi:hypothetical protein